MAFLGGNIIPPDLSPKLLFAGIAGLVFVAVGVSRLTSKPSQKSDENPGLVKSLLLFCYSCFLKPHKGDKRGGSQQDALESFYAAQAGVYDATRKTLLKGREDMLALVAAQLRFKAEGHGEGKKKRIWVDV